MASKPWNIALARVISGAHTPVSVGCKLLSPNDLQVFQALAQLSSPSAAACVTAPNRVGGNPASRQLLLRTALVSKLLSLSSPLFQSSRWEAFEAPSGLFV